MSGRTLKIKSPHMTGDDVEHWQKHINSQFASWGIDYRVTVDSDYGVTTRAATATLLHALGIGRAAMADGVTPALRTKARNRKLTPVERARFAARTTFRRRLRARHNGGGVAPPLAKILASSWGWNPGHDGVDLICNARAPLYAMVAAKVIRADNGGWWGKAPSGDVTKGDGIIVLEVLQTIGPFKKGMRLCYGHAEDCVVKVGDVVRAGEHIGRAGLAVAWHIHFMVHTRNDARGTGDRDPMPYVRYAIKHA